MIIEFPEDLPLLLDIFFGDLRLRTNVIGQYLQSKSRDQSGRFPRLRIHDNTTRFRRDGFERQGVGYTNVATRHDYHRIVG